MMMHINGHYLHVSDDGPRDAPVLVFANSLGTDLRLWDQMITHLDRPYRIIRYDKRGHGLSDGPVGAYFMGDLVADLAAILDALRVQDAVLVGLSIGGMIAQGLAAERPDLLRAVVFSNTGTKIGTEDMWAERIANVHEHGIKALADGTMARWFSRAFHQDRPDELTYWRNMLCRTWVEGYLGCAAAISGTDLFESTSGLRLPVLGIAGSEDGSTPPDMVRELTEIVPGAEFALIKGAGHLPCVEQPENYARILEGFLQKLG